MARKLKSRSRSRSAGKRKGKGCSGRRLSKCPDQKCYWVIKKGCRSRSGRRGKKSGSPKVKKSARKSMRRKGVNCSKRRLSKCVDKSCKWVIGKGCKSRSGKYAGSVARGSPRRSPVLPMYSYSM